MMTASFCICLGTGIENLECKLGTAQDLSLCLFLLTQTNSVHASPIPHTFSAAFSPALYFTVFYPYHAPMPPSCEGPLPSFHFDNRKLVVSHLCSFQSFAVGILWLADLNFIFPPRKSPLHFALVFCCTLLLPAQH